MKNVVPILLVSILLITAGVGCKSLNIFGKSAKAEDKQRTKVELVDKAIGENVQKKLDEVAIFSSGTDYALNKVTNKEPFVEIAKDINLRVMSLSGKPDFEAEKEMWKTIDQLGNDLEMERIKGKRALAKKDNEIKLLQIESKYLVSTKEDEISKYMNLAQTTARQSDTYKSTLNQMDKWFGLGAVFYGIKKFIFSSILTIGIIFVLYLLLRAFAHTNPIVGSVFAIFEIIAGWFIHLIKGIAPGAIKFANFVPKVEFDGYKHTLDKIVDTVQFLKEKEKESKIEVKYTLSELLVELDKSLDESDKDRIKECKKDLKWK